VIYTKRGASNFIMNLVVLIKMELFVLLFLKIKRELYQHLVDMNILREHFQLFGTLLLFLRLQ
jgi:hypothetical protein